MSGCIETTKEEMTEERFKREAQDGGLRKSRRLEQRPKRNYPDVVFRHEADFDGEIFCNQLFLRNQIVTSLHDRDSW